MQAVILKCAPNSRFHFGEVAERQSAVLNDTATYIHSDVLFGAFLNTLNQRYPEKTETFIQYFSDDKLAFSSGFYCLENKNNKKLIYLLPKPISLNLTETKEPKKLKKIEFISKGVWEKGITPEQWLNENGKCFMPSSNFIVLNEELGNGQSAFKLYAKADAPKVKVRSENEERNFYHQTDLMLSGNECWQVHWYFLLQSNLNDEEMSVVKKVFHDMTLSGIGGERSTGCGYIQSVEMRDFSFDPIIKNNVVQYAALSLTIPANTEETGKLLLYQTKKRGGMFVGANQRLKIVPAVLEGAIQLEKIMGKIIDISSHGRQSLRYGKNFVIPIPESFYFQDY